MSGSPKSFQRKRQALVAAGLVGPPLLLAGVWWLAANVLLAPRLPNDKTSALDCVAFICHEKGLPRLGPAASERFLFWQTKRFLGDVNFARQFAAALRTSSPEEKLAFAANMFDAFKPLFMRDVDTWAGAAGEKQATFLDERIVEYNRMSRLSAGSQTAGADLGPGLEVDQVAMLQMVLSKTTEQERAAAQQYIAALTARVMEILADPELRAEFEKRIGIAPPG